MCGSADDANSPETLASIMLDVGGGAITDFALAFLGRCDGLSVEMLEGVDRFVRWMEREGLVKLTAEGSLSRPPS